MIRTAAMERAAARGPTWRGLLAVAAGAELLALVAVAAVLGDREAGGVAGGVVFGIGLLRSRFRTVGVVLLGLTFIDVAGFMVPATLTNLLDRAAVTAVFIPSLLAAISLAGAAAVVGLALSRGRSGAGRGGARAVAAAAGGAFALALASSVGFGGAPPVGAAGVLRLEAKNVEFSGTALSTDAGSVTVELANGDLFWHTFTIDELNVDLKVPVGAAKQIRFVARPGTYTFYCAVPGHAAAGMRGTLTLR